MTDATTDQPTLDGMPSSNIYAAKKFSDPVSTIYLKATAELGKIPYLKD